MDYFTEVSHGRLDRQSKIECDLLIEQAATVTQISKEKGNVIYLDSDTELWDSLDQL